MYASHHPVAFLHSINSLVKVTRIKRKNNQLHIDEQCKNQENFQSSRVIVGPMSLKVLYGIMKE